MTNRISFIALETSSVDINLAKLIEIGIVTSDIGEGLKGYSTTSWRTYLHPSTPIEPETSAFHHISNEMVKDAPIIEEWDVVESIEKIMHRTDNLCIFHAGYAMRIIEKYPALESMLSSCTGGLKPLNLLLLTSNLWPDLQIVKNRLQTYRYTFQLDKVIDRLHPEHSNATHLNTTLQKAWITEALLLKALFETGKTYQELAEISQQVKPVLTMPFGKYIGKPITQLVAENFGYLQGLWAAKRDYIEYDFPGLFITLKPYME